MKIYVDKMPKKISECEFCFTDTGKCMFGNKKCNISSCNHLLALEVDIEDADNMANIEEEENNEPIDTTISTESD